MESLLEEKNSSAIAKVRRNDVVREEEGGGVWWWRRKDADVSRICQEGRMDQGCGIVREEASVSIRIH